MFVGGGGCDLHISLSLCCSSACLIMSEVVHHHGADGSAAAVATSVNVPPAVDVGIPRIAIGFVAASGHFQETKIVKIIAGSSDAFGVLGFLHDCAACVAPSFYQFPKGI